MGISWRLLDRVEIGPQVINIAKMEVMIGGLLGIMMIFLFSAWAIVGACPEPRRTTPFHRSSSRPQHHGSCIMAAASRQQHHGSSISVIRSVMPRLA